LIKRSEKFVDISSENNEEHVTELRHLWRDVMLKACSKLRDLQNVLHGIMMKGLHTEGFSKTLSECQYDVRDLLERLQECCSVDVSDDPTVAVAQYQVWKYFWPMDNLHVRLNFNLSKEKGIKHHS
jgi:hypothetical protein